MRSILTGTLVAAASLSGASAACTKARAATYPSTNGTQSASSSYDYIVVGGGPAGIIAATRLAQSSDKSVLLVSRGQGPTVGTGAVGTVGWNESLTPIDVPGLSTAVSDYDVGDENLFTAYLCDDVIDSYAACVFGGGATFNCESTSKIKPAMGS